MVTFESVSFQPPILSQRCSSPDHVPWGSREFQRLYGSDFRFECSSSEDETVQSSPSSLPPKSLWCLTFRVPVSKMCPSDTCHLIVSITQVEPLRPAIKFALYLGDVITSF